MNRRFLLSFLGLAPLAIATGAVAESNSRAQPEPAGRYKFKTVRIPFLTTMRGDTTRVIELETSDGWNFVSFVPVPSHDQEILFRRWESET